MAQYAALVTLYVRMLVCRHMQVKHPACQLSIKSQLRLCGRRAADWPVFRRGRGWHHGLVLGADMAILPGPSAPGAEDVVTSRARHSGGLALCVWLQTTHRLALEHRAPGFTGVQLHSCRQSKELEVTGQFWSRHPTAKALFSINTATAILSVPLLLKLQFRSRGSAWNVFLMFLEGNRKWLESIYKYLCLTHGEVIRWVLMEISTMPHVFVLKLKY